MHECPLSLYGPVRSRLRKKRQRRKGMTEPNIADDALLPSPPSVALSSSLIQDSLFFFNRLLKISSQLEPSALFLPANQGFGLRASFLLAKWTRQLFDCWS